MAGRGETGTSTSDGPQGDELTLLTGSNAVKVILLGDSAVGKSKLVERFLLDGYRPHQLSTYALTLYRYALAAPKKSSSNCLWCLVTPSSGIPDAEGRSGLVLHNIKQNILHVCV